MNKKFLILGALMTSRWVVYGFMDIALTAILRDAGASLYQISLMLGAGFLFMFKFLWAPLVDTVRLSGKAHYQSWFVLTQALLSAGLAALLLFDPARDFYIIFGILVVSSIAATFRDIAMDGLTVRILDHGERVTANGYMNAGFMLGTVVGGGALLAAYPSIGWRGVVVALIACTALAIPLVWRLPEPSRRHGGAEPPIRKILLEFFSHKGNVAWSITLMLASAAGTLATSLLVVMLVDNKWSLVKIGLIMNIAGPLLALLASLIAGHYLTRFSRRWALLVTLAIQAVANLVLLPLPRHGYTEVLAVTVVVFGIVVAALNNQAAKTVVTDKSAVGSHPGTYATIQSSLSQIGGLICLVAAPAAAEMFGYQAVIIAAGVLAAFAAVLAASLRTID